MGQPGQYLPVGVKKVILSPVTVWPETKKAFEGAAKELNISMSSLMDFFGVAVEFLRKGGCREVKAGGFQKIAMEYRRRRAGADSVKAELREKAIENGPWSTHFAACVECKQTDSPHQVRGVCRRCWTTKKKVLRENS